MTAAGRHVPKYARVAAAVRAQIADGALRPGQPAPSGAALSRVTGYSTLTCRRALRLLVADGVLLPGPSRSARPRVAGPLQRAAERDLAAAARALSAGLAARRRASGLTQPGLAALLDVSVTTIGHAETGRLWQSRQFWEHVDAALGADGDLLRLRDAFGEASAASAASAAAPAGTAETEDAGDREPGDGEDPECRERGDVRDLAREQAPDCAALSREPGLPPGSCPLGGPADVQPAAPWRQAGPACVMIMWGDGTVTTVHPPQAPAPGTSPEGEMPACGDGIQF